MWGELPPHLAGDRKQNTASFSYMIIVGEDGTVKERTMG
jgi:hypothetical protein